MNRTVFVCALLSIGCDRLDGNADPGPDANVDGDAVDGDAVDGDAGPVAASLVVAEQTTAAPQSAVIASAIHNAARTEPDEAEPLLPVTLSDLRVSFKEDDDEPTELQLTVDAKVNRAVWEGTDLWVKVRCRTDDEVYGEASEVSAVTSAELSTVAVGDSIVMEASFEGLNADAARSRCDLRFVLAGGYGGGPVIEVGEACREDGAAALGPCATPIGNAAASGFAVPLEVLSLGVDPDTAFGGLSVQYGVRLNEPLKDEETLAIKAACDVGDKVLVDTTTESLSWGPFVPEPGEAVAGEVNLLWGVDGVDTRPEHCDLTVSLAKRTPFSSGSSRLVHEACLDGATVKARPCSPSRPPEPAAKPATASSLEVDGLAMTVDSHYRHGDQFTVELALDATVRVPLDGGFDLDVLADCRVGRVAYRDQSSVEIPAGTRSGETARLETLFFSRLPLDAEPGSCRFELRAETAGTKTTLATWCARGEKIVPGGC